MDLFGTASVAVNTSCSDTMSLSYALTSFTLFIFLNICYKYRRYFVFISGYNFQFSFYPAICLALLFIIVMVLHSGFNTDVTC